MSDKNYRSYADETNVVIQNDTIDAPNPEQFDDILKLSHVVGCTVDNCHINPSGGNREDGIDIMRFCRSIYIRNCQVGAGAKYAFTIKGGSSQIDLSNVTITRGGGGSEKVDIDIGNYSDNAKGRTTDVMIVNCRRSDGQPIRVRVGWADNPVIIGGNVKILFWKSLLLKIYVFIKNLFYKK
jgi:hypothetical protein